MKKIVKWLSSPSSRAGETAVLSAVVGAVSGATTWLHAVPLMAFGVAMIAMPDNSVAQKDIEKLVADAIDAGAAVRGTVISKTIA